MNKILTVVLIIVFLIIISLVFLSTNNSSFTNKLVDTSTWETVNFYDKLKKAPLGTNQDFPKFTFKYPNEFQLGVFPMVSGIGLEKRFAQYVFYRINISSLPLGEPKAWLIQNSCNETPSKVEENRIAGMTVFISSKSVGCKENDVLFAENGKTLFYISEDSSDMERIPQEEQKRLESIFWTVVSTIKKTD